MISRRRRTFLALAATGAILAGAAISPISADADINSDVVADIFTPTQRANIQFSDALRPLTVEFADVFAGRSLYEESVPTTIRYNETAEDERIRAFQAAVRRIPTVNGQSVAFEARDYSEKRRQDLAVELATDPAVAVTLLGVEVSGTEFDPETGLIWVSVPGQVTEDRTIEAPDGTPIVLTGRQATIDFQVGR